jgi:site-specific recombinase XerD
MLTPFPERLEQGHNPAAVYLARLPSAQSQRTMRAALNNIAVISGIRSDIRVEVDRQGRPRRRDLTYLSFHWATLRFQHIVAIRAKLSELYQPASVNKMLTALRGVLAAAYELEMISAEDYQRAIKVKSVKVRPKSTGRTLNKREIKTLVRVCKADKSPAGARDLALIAVLYIGGLRPSELVAIDLEDYDRASGKLVVRQTQGRKSRTVYLPGRAKLAMEVWLITRDLWPGPLFCTINKAGRLGKQAMTTQAVYKLLKKRGEQAGIREFSAHTLRRTCIANLLKEGVDLATVARLVGHTSLYTTARYAQPPEEVLRKAAGVLRFPF